MKNQIILKGSSGVNIYFYKDSRGVKIVRKKTTKKEQIDRLRIQFEKHQFLLNQKNNLFNIPEILNHGFDKELFFYEYRYIEGSTMTQTFIEKSNKQLSPIMDELLSVIKYFSKQNFFYEIFHIDKRFKEILHEKIISNSDYLESNLRERFLTVLEKLNFPLEKTMYHGDLTFENIIVDKNNKIWLIDCIGTFYPHYWFDISTLFQEIEGEWSHIKHGVKLDKQKAKYFTNYLKKNIATFDKQYLTNHQFLMSIKFLRILPYLKSKSQKLRVLKKINDYLGEKLVDK